MTAQVVIVVISSYPGMQRRWRIWCCRRSHWVREAPVMWMGWWGVVGVALLSSDSNTFVLPWRVTISVAVVSHVVFAFPVHAVQLQTTTNHQATACTGGEHQADVLAWAVRRPGCCHDPVPAKCGHSLWRRRHRGAVVVGHDAGVVAGVRVHTVRVGGAGGRQRRHSRAAVPTGHS